MDFSDIAQQYLTNRIDQATQPFSDPEGYMQDRFGNVKPTSTTINYNDDGSRSITHKAEIPAPVAPTEVQQPVAQPQPQPMPQAVAPQAPAPVAQPQPQPTAQPMPQPMAQGPVAPQATMQPAVYNPGQGQGNPNLAPNGTWNDFQDQSQLPPEARMPQPGVANAQMPIQGQPAPGAVTPGPAQMTPAVATQPQPQPQPQPAVQGPSWSNDLVNSQGDAEKLRAYALDPKYPENARLIAGELYAKQADQDRKKQEAFEKIKLLGDPTKQDQVIRDLRKNNDEGSYIKAVLFARLGLNDLARQEQQKLGAGQKISRTMLDGNSYTTDVDGNGFTQRAWDQEGRPVDDNTLSRINAQGTPFGTHAYGFTGGLHTLPSTHELLQPRTNSITGQSEFVYTTGPHKGEVYTGSEVPQPQSIGTAIAKKEGTEAVTLNYAGALSATRGGAGAIGKFNAENGTNLAIPTYGPNKGRLVDMNNGGQVVTPDAQGNFNPVANPAVTGNAGEDLSEGLRSKITSGVRSYTEQKNLWDQSVANGTPGKLPNGLPVARPGGTTHETGNALDIPPAKLTQEDRRELAQKGYYQPFPNDPVHWEKITTPSRAGAAPTAAPENAGPQLPKFREPGHEQESMGQYKARLKTAEEANKVISKKTGEQVANAGAVNDTIINAQHAIDLIDSGNHNIGQGIGGFVHGRGPIAQAIGNQFETEGARNTRAIMDVVRQIGGAASQSTIKGHLTNQELQFLTENKPTADSDPQYTKQWLEKSIKTMQRVQGQAEEQARTGGQATNPVTANAGAPTEKKATKRYNPETKKFEEIK